MTTLLNAGTNLKVGSGLSRIMSERNLFTRLAVLAPPNEDGTPTAEEAAAKVASDAAAKVIADAAAKKLVDDAAAALAAKNKPTDAEAKLLKEVMASKKLLEDAATKAATMQAELDKYKGVDPEEAKKLKLAADEAEKARLTASGDFARLTKMQGEEHLKEVTGLKDVVAASKTQLEQAQAMINDLTIGQAFSNSEFVKGDLVMPAAKVRTIYGAHFEIDGTQIVGYDKPKGTAERTKLVDGSGSAMSFEEAMKRIIEKDADRDSLLKSKVKPGAGSSTEEIAAAAAAAALAAKTGGIKGLSRIAAALADQKAAKAKK